MESVGGAIAIVAVTLWGLYYVARSLRSLWIYRELVRVDSEHSPASIDGEEVAVEGTVTVDEEAPASDLATDGSVSPVALYVWRVVLTGGVGRDTVESGVEFGLFSITTDNGEIRVDPSWLREAHDAPKLADVRTDSRILSRPDRVYLWRSPYVHLGNEPTTMPLARVSDVIEADLDISLDGNDFESKAVSEGTRLAVYGELSIDQGTPTIRGTDDTPLFVTNCGIDTVRSNLLGRAVTYGFYLTLVLTLDLVLVYDVLL